MSNLPLAGSKTSNDALVNGFFDGYYTKTIDVSGQEFDAVLAFFLRRCNGDRIAAEALTSSIMVLAMNRGLSAIGLVEDFKKINDNQAFKAALIALLNSDRRPTSKLGYAATPMPNEYVARNVHQ